MYSFGICLQTVSINLEDTIIDGLIHAGIGMHTLLGRITEVARTTEPNPWDEKVMFEPRSAMEEVGMQVQDDKLNHERFWGRMEKVSRYGWVALDRAYRYCPWISSSVMMVRRSYRPYYENFSTNKVFNRSQTSSSATLGQVRWDW